jgi:hypothetical protein
MNKNPRTKISKIRGLKLQKSKNKSYKIPGIKSYKNPGTKFT